MAVKILIQQKIQAGFAASLAFLLVAGASAWWSAQRNAETFRAVEHTHQVMDVIEDVLVDMLNVQTGIRGFAISGDEAFLQPYQIGIAELQEEFEAAKRLTRDNPEQQRLLAVLEPLIQARISRANEVIQLRRSGDSAGAFQIIASRQGKAGMDEIRRLIAEMEKKERELLERRTAQALATNRTTIVIVTFGGLLSLGLVGFASVVVRRDFEKRQQAEDSLRQLNAELATANQELAAFSYSVSHDLRAPLRSIDGFSQVIEEDYGDKLDDAGRDHLARVRAATRRMSGLIDDLLKLSRITRAEMQRVPMDLSALAREIAGELQRREPQRRVQWEIADELSAQGDPQLLRVALENLLGNAWKFTGKRADAVIQFGRLECDGQTVFCVRDNGAGFDMAYAKHLFGAFQRMHSVAEFDGTGIGLATVQRIMHRHGGRVWAEAEVDKGAVFHFTLQA